MTIAYLYYDFLNLYGESGNIKIIDRILNENKIKHKILYLSLNDNLNFEKYDLVYIGSGTEENQKIALEHLLKYKKEIKEYINDNKFVLVTGNSVSLFANTLNEEEALGIINANVTTQERKKNDYYKNGILGFINNCDKLNQEFDDIININNSYFTYILGPILVRNPKLVKELLNKLTNKKLKYDLKLEIKAYNQFIKNFKEDL